MNFIQTVKCEDKNRSILNTTAQRQSRQRSIDVQVAQPRQFIDLRPAVLSQHKIGEVINESPNVKALAAMQQSMNQSARIAAQTKRVEPINKSVSKALPNAPPAQRLDGPEQLMEEREEIRPAILPAQRKCRACEGEDKLPLQKKDAGTGMPDAVQANMENSLGIELSGVRLHKNSEQAEKVGALAFTRGNDLHFAPGQFRPDTAHGRELIGHELTHVVQQRQGRVKATAQAAGLPINDDPSLEKEADEMGKLAAQGQRGLAGMLPPLSATATAQVIQGLFPTDYMQKVATGKQVTGNNLLTKQQEQLTGVFLLQNNTTQGCEIQNYDTREGYLVDWTQINDASLWEDVPQSPFMPYFIPRIAPIKVAPELLSRRGRTTGSEPVSKSRSAKRKKEDKSTLERSSFVSVERSTTTPQEQPFFSPGTKSTGYERLSLLGERQTQSSAGIVKESSLVGRPDTEQAITYCSYCLNWFTPPQLDSDHGITWKVIGSWLLGIADRMNTEGASFVQAVRLQFKSVGLDIGNFFRPLSGKTWEATEYGAELMFNNVKNLALSCKTCNQLERNDEEFMDFMKRQLHFGEPFLKWLDQQGVKLEGKEVVSSKGQYAGELVHMWIQITPYVKQAIEQYRLIKLKSIAETERVKRFTSATIKGEKKAARGALEKQQLHHALHNAVEEAIDSEGEEEFDELHKQLPVVIKESKELIQKGIEIRPKWLVEDLDEAEEEVALLNEDVSELQYDLERERKKRKVSIEETKELTALLEEANELTASEQYRADRAEQYALYLEERSEDLQKQLQAMQEQMLQMQKLLMQPQNPTQSVFGNPPPKGFGGFS